VSDTDPPLSAGAYTVVLYVEESRTSALKPDVLVDTATLTKTDSDLRRGQLRAHIIFAAGVADDQEAVTGIEAALVRWQRVYAEVGIDLRTRTSSSDITAELETPAFNNDAVAAASQLSDGSELTVLLGESLPGGLIGYSGGLPGGFFPSGTSAIVVSWLAASGPDARFSEDEIDSLGDVLAHEAGHYLGLFHPFAIYGESSPFRSWDAIDDTVECTTTNECEAALATNLMFPYVVTDDAGQIVEHHEVTPAQRSVLHRYGGMR
jgi:hypothetical protein